MIDSNSNLDLTNVLNKCSKKRGVENWRLNRESNPGTLSAALLIKER